MKSSFRLMPKLLCQSAVWHSHCLVMHSSISAAMETLHFYGYLDWTYIKASELPKIIGDFALKHIVNHLQSICLYLIALSSRIVSRTASASLTIEVRPLYFPIYVYFQVLRWELEIRLPTVGEIEAWRVECTLYHKYWKQRLGSLYPDGYLKKDPQLYWRIPMERDGESYRGCWGKWVSTRRTHCESRSQCRHKMKRIDCSSTNHPM